MKRRGRRQYYWRAQLETSQSTPVNMSTHSDGEGQAIGVDPNTESEGCDTDISVIPQTNQVQNLTDRTIIGNENNFNSTEVTPQNDAFSRHREPEFIQDFQETPWGEGRHSVRSESPDVSVVTLSSLLEDIRQEIDDYGSQFTNQEGWIFRIELEHKRLKEELDTLERRCLREHALDLVIKIGQVIEDLNTFREQLKARAQNMELNASRVVLDTSRLNNVTDNESPSTVQHNLTSVQGAGGQDLQQLGNGDNEVDQGTSGESEHNIDKSLEDRHGLIEIIKEVINSKFGDLCRLDMANRIPAIEKRLKDLPSSQDMNDVTAEIQTFKDQFGNRKSLEQILKQNNELKGQLQDVMKQTALDKKIIPGLQEQLTRSNTLVTQLEASFKSITRWVVKLEERLDEKEGEGSTRVISDNDCSTQGFNATAAHKTARQNMSKSECNPRRLPANSDRQNQSSTLSEALRLSECNGVTRRRKSISLDRQPEGSTVQETMGTDRLNVWRGNQRSENNRTNHRRMSVSLDRQAEGSSVQETVGTDSLNAFRDNLRSGQGRSVPTRLNRNFEEELSAHESLGSPRSNVSESSAQTKIHERRITRVCKEIDSLISTDISSASPIADELLTDLYQNVMPDINKLCKECDDSLIQYAKLRDHDTEMADNAADLIVRGYSWVFELKRMYRERQLHLRSNSSQIISGNLKAFDGGPSQTVFEFFKKFEQLTNGKYTQTQKTTLLYDTYLHERLKQQLVALSQNFQDMKDWLIKKFGKAKGIVNGKTDLIKNLKQPTASATSVQKADYYRSVYAVLAELQNLHISSDIPKDDVALYIYTHDAIEKVLSFLPEMFNDLYSDKVDELGKDLDSFQGKAAFDLLMKLAERQFTKADRNATKLVNNWDRMQSGERGTKKSPVRKSVNAVSNKSAESSESSSEDDDLVQSVHHQSSKASGDFMKGKKNKENSKWYDSSVKFPCPIKDHNHELGSCKEFFGCQASVKKKLGFRKSCYACLGPRDKCKEKCVNLKRMPTRLTCQECAEYAKAINKSPFNILICTNAEHSKVQLEDLLKDCEKWFPSFRAPDMRMVFPSASIHLVAMTNKCVTCHYGMKQCHCVTPPSKTSPCDPEAVVPNVDTSNGENIDVDEDLIVCEKKEECIYIMQVLDIRGEECLAFYDRGANEHLIDGELAEKANLKVLNPKNQAIGVVGGGRIWTNYGQYCVRLGPTPEGKFHEMNCQGISKITAEFPYYDLSRVNKEVKTSGKLKPYNSKLPKYVGGAKVKLLLGIKDTYLDPDKLFSLPCGLGVYQSQLMDRFQSRICYGGPHKLFTEVNRKTGGNVNHVSAFFTEMVTSYKKSLYPVIVSGNGKHSIEDEMFSAPMTKGIAYSIQTPANIELHPTPLAAADFSNAAFSVTDERDRLAEMAAEEECLDQCNKPCFENKVGQEPKAVHVCSVYKAKVPLSKQIEKNDQEDIDGLVNYRCSVCSKCIKCQESSRTMTMSLRESMEQELIERSVVVDTDEEKVIVSLPFTEDPIKYLTKRHNGPDNLYQATRVYKSQCKKSPETKEAIRKVHKDLVDKGFIVKLSDLTQEQQDIINDNEFKQYYVWRTVEKPDSTSTPLRMVVDPSCSGLNLILPKGENNMARIYDILVRNRCYKYIFSTDVSKLYNQLWMDNASLAYQLMLYSESLDPEKAAEVWVLVRGWYGVRQTGSQAGHALRKLAVMFRDKFPLAEEIVLKNIYVDDAMAGANSKETREMQIDQTRELLKKGGFKLKYIVRSGEDPPDNASTDGKTLKILGYKYTPKEDTLGFGFQELNFNKKVRGAKKPNLSPVVSESDVSRALVGKLITRRVVVSKIAELYDPVGIWEPYKLQLKLENSLLNGLDWDVPLPEELQDHWKTRFKEFVDIPLLEVSRCIIPEEAVHPEKIRLLCLSDAAVYAGGTAIYAGCELRDGTYSCQLLTSKSQMMDGSIPRNELEAVCLMAKLAFLVSKALGSIVEDILYFTDSTVALSWCHNTEKKLKMYVFNRVSTARRYMQWAKPAAETISLFHIDGKANIADLLTKSHDMSPSALNKSSEWMTGMPWMRLKSHEIPKTTYDQLTVSKSDIMDIDKECFSTPKDPTPKYSKQSHDMDVSSSVGSQTIKDSTESSRSETLNVLGEPGLTVHHCSTCKASAGTIQPSERCYGKSDSNQHCLDCQCTAENTHSVFLLGKGTAHTRYSIPVISLGWKKSIGVMSKVCLFAYKLIHRTHKLAKNQELSQRMATKCPVCKKAQSFVDGTALTRSKENQVLEKFFSLESRYLGENYLFKIAALELETGTKAKSLKDNYTLSNGIYYYSGRLSDATVGTADLDFSVYFDNTEIKTITPVVSASSPVFFTYLIHVHDSIRPHSGVEITLREVSKVMHVVNNPRQVISKVRRDCTKCKMISKKTLELHMANHDPARTVMAPPFYNCQMDVVYGFKANSWKNARKVFDIYALVIVCLLTSATNILVLEGLETLDVVTALERHSSRYGVPAKVFVDAGSQLVALQSVSLSLRDVDGIVHDSLGLAVKVSTPKSHEERGRVEAKVKVVRQVLTKMSVKGSDPLTAIGWETVFAKVANQIDDVPFAMGNTSNVHDFGKELLTANRIKLGRNNYRSLEGSISLAGFEETKLLDRIREINTFFYQSILDRLHMLIPRPAKWNKTDEVNVGDVCVFVYKDSGSAKMWTWLLGKVLEVVERGKIKLEYFTPVSKRKMSVVRCPRQVVKIHDIKDLPVNTVDYFEKNIIHYK